MANQWLLFLTGGIRGQERNETGKLLAHPVPKAFEPEAFVLEAAGKDGGTHLAQELRLALSKRRLSPAPLGTAAPETPVCQPCRESE